MLPYLLQHYFCNILPEGRLLKTIWKGWFIETKVVLEELLRRGQGNFWIEGKNILENAALCLGVCLSGNIEKQGFEGIGVFIWFVVCFFFWGVGMKGVLAIMRDVEHSYSCSDPSMSKYFLINLLFHHLDVSIYLFAD